MLGKICVKCNIDKPLDCYRSGYIKNKKKYRNRIRCVSCTNQERVDWGFKHRVCTNGKYENAFKIGESTPKIRKYFSNRKYWEEHKKDIVNRKFSININKKKHTFYTSTFSHPEILSLMIEIRGYNYEIEKLIKNTIVGKLCRCCLKDVPIEDFSVLKNGKTHTWCRPCACSYVKNKKDKA